MAVAQPLTPQVRITDPQTGYLTREGFRLLQSLQQSIGEGGFQPADPALTALSGLNTTPGLLVHNAPDAFVKRSIDVGPGLSVSNDNGVGGNPTISLGAVLALLNNTFAVGTWSPSLVGVTNVDSVSLSGVGHYVRIGALVVGTFAANVDRTAGSDTFTQFSFTLPVPSNFTASEDCLGTVAFVDAQRAGVVGADAATDLGTVSFVSEGTSSAPLGCIFTYLVQ